RVRGLVWLLLGVAAAAAPAKKPSKLEVLRLLQGAVPGARSVSDVLADAGDDRFPVLFVVRGRHCLEREIDGQKEQNCSPTTAPHVALVRRGDGGKLALESELTLPTEAPAWDQQEELK